MTVQNYAVPVLECMELLLKSINNKLFDEAGMVTGSTGDDYKESKVSTPGGLLSRIDTLELEIAGLLGDLEEHNEKVDNE